MVPPSAPMRDRSAAERMLDQAVVASFHMGSRCRRARRADSRAERRRPAVIADLRQGHHEATGGTHKAGAIPRRSPVPVYSRACDVAPSLDVAIAEVPRIGATADGGAASGTTRSGNEERFVRRREPRSMSGRRVCPTSATVLLTHPSSPCPSIRMTAPGGAGPAFRGIFQER